MSSKKRGHPKLKPKLHPRNRHRERYDLAALTRSFPELQPYIHVNKYGDESVDFFEPEAVKALNKAILIHHYGLQYWDIPTGYLCPPIPGRADYIHHVADLLSGHGPTSDFNKISRGSKIKCLDIGVGANCVYPIIGNKEYGWSFVGTDIDPISVENAKSILAKNQPIDRFVKIRLQRNKGDIFRGVVRSDERFHLTICNPPFHASLEEATAGSIRKLKNLKQKIKGKPVLNFGGSDELWCDGGESKFLESLIHQSKLFSMSSLWFTTLVSKQSNLKRAYHQLKSAKPTAVKTINMGTGNKITRVLAWSFQNNNRK